MSSRLARNTGSISSSLPPALAVVGGRRLPAATRELAGIAGAKEQ